jgi:hypothetical protein
MAEQSERGHPSGEQAKPNSFTKRRTYGFKRVVPTTYTTIDGHKPYPHHSWNYGIGRSKRSIVRWIQEKLGREPIFRDWRGASYRVHVVLLETTKRFTAD